MPPSPKGNEPIFLEGQRILLREFRLEDAPFVHAYASDPEVTRYMPWGPNTWDDTLRFLQEVIFQARQTPREIFELAIILKEDGRLIGGAGIRVEEEGRASLGYILHREAWGRGLATEAGRLLIAFARERLSLREIFATCHPDNRASQRVLEKLGMELQGMVEGRLLYTLSCGCPEDPPGVSTASKDGPWPGHP